MRKSIAEVAKLYGAEYKRFFECVDFLAAHDNAVITKELLDNELKPIRIDNTCNYAEPLAIYFEEYERPNEMKFIIFKIHKGGDPRGNYSDNFVFLGSWRHFWDSVYRLGGSRITKKHNGIELSYELAWRCVFADGVEIDDDEFYQITEQTIEEFF